MKPFRWFNPSVSDFQWKLTPAEHKRKKERRNFVSLFFLHNTINLIGFEGLLWLFSFSSMVHSVEIVKNRSMDMCREKEQEKSRLGCRCTRAHFLSLSHISPAASSRVYLSDRCCGRDAAGRIFSYSKYSLCFTSSCFVLFSFSNETHSTSIDKMRWKYIQSFICSFSLHCKLMQIEKEKNDDIIQSVLLF